MMKLTPNENVLRVALIVFSVLFGILSVFLIALGIVYIHELWWPKRYAGLDFIELPILLIILGSVSLVMAIAGCFCAKTYNRLFLILFAAVLLVILLFELTIAIIAFINFDKHERSHSTTHLLLAKDYKVNPLLLQELEDHYKCCGIYANETECLQEVSIIYQDSVNVTEIPFFGTVSCADAVDEHIQTMAAEIGYFTVVLALLQIVQLGYVFFIHQSVAAYCNGRGV